MMGEMSQQTISLLHCQCCTDSSSSKNVLLGMVNNVRHELPQLTKDTAQQEVFSTSMLRSGSDSLTIYASKKKQDRVCFKFHAPRRDNW